MRRRIRRTAGDRLAVFAFAAGLTFATTFAFGVVPALRSSRSVDQTSLRSRTAGGGRTDRLRAALVLGEVIGAVVLLVAAGLLLKAMWHVQAVDTGFPRRGCADAEDGPSHDDARRFTAGLLFARARRCARAGRRHVAAYITLVPMTGDPTALVPAPRRIVHAIDPEQSISDGRPLDDIVSAQTASRRAQFSVLASFAALALLLAAVGIYGLLSFAVSMRTREVGVRMALGAHRRDVLTMFLQQGRRSARRESSSAYRSRAAGRAMTSLLFGVAPGDPALYAAAALLAVLMTLAGSVRPALRAANVDPVIAIQSE